MARVKLSQRTWNAAMTSAAVRRALGAKADQVATRARGLAESEGVKMTVERSGGRRPRGRAFERVSSPDGAGQEWGTARQPRRRILGRAAGSS